MTPACKEVLDYIDKEGCGVTLMTLYKFLPDLDQADIRVATRTLYETMRVARISVKGDNDRLYYVFFSLYIRSTNSYQQLDPNVMPSPVALPVPSPVALPVPSPVASEPELTEPMRQALIERLEADLAVPERRGVERRGVERRTLTALEVIDRWKLSYRLSRIIEIISTARKVQLTKSDAVSVAKLIREHVRGQ